MTPGALSGLVIADFSRVLAGPYATMLLADLGADVVKVERPETGDDTRAWGPPFGSGGRSTYFDSVNRNKRSVAIDLQTSVGLARAHDLVVSADVVVENFQAGTLDRLGLGYQTLSAGNPGLIYCSITGFGAGEGAGLPGYDLLVQAMGGLMSITGPAPDQPTKVGVALVDVIAGLHAVYGILAALRYRDTTGEGQHVEVNLLSSLLSAMVNQSGALVGAGVVPRTTGNDHPSIAPYGLYKARDLSFALAVGNDRQFKSLCDALELAELAKDPRFATNPDRVNNFDALRRLLESKLTEESAKHWCAVLAGRGVACGPVNDLAAAFMLATSLGLDPVVEIAVAAAADPRNAPSHISSVANPVRLSRTPPTYRFPPPGLDGG